MFARFLAPLLGLPLLACAGDGPADKISANLSPAATGYTAAALANACSGRSGWSDPAPPAHLFGNSWLVGTCGITVVLITSDQGHVLIDGGPADAAPLVAANISRLGFKINDVKLILSSHEHFDHAGALAELQRLSGAKVAALEASAPVLTSGNAAIDDPQHDSLPAMAPVKIAQTVRDGEIVTLGPISLTAFATPAHSPGSTSWAWTSCDGADCRTITYADSISTISADGYRFTDHADRIAAVRAGLDQVEHLPCGILITPHPSVSGMFERFASSRALNDAAACKAYADGGRARFASRLNSETAK